MKHSKGVGIFLLLVGVVLIVLDHLIRNPAYTSHAMAIAGLILASFGAYGWTTR